MSRSAWSARIEISASLTSAVGTSTSRSAWSARIEITIHERGGDYAVSRSAWSARIEIALARKGRLCLRVALRLERAD